jgi:hypothetical protein
VQTGVQEDLTAHLSWVDQVVDIISFDTVQFVHQKEEAEEVDDKTSHFTAPLPQIVRSKTIKALSKGSFKAEERPTTKDKIHHLLHHHKVV